VRELIAKRLTELRGQRSRRDVANAVGVSESAWAMWENAERVPKDEIKMRIADEFGRSVQEIFFDPELHEMCLKKQTDNKEVG